jgi:hypothetical protein
MTWVESDADTLGRLDQEVLRGLDPPLNLQGMPQTPIRRRVKELRRPHALSKALSTLLRPDLRPSAVN